MNLYSWNDLKIGISESFQVCITKEMLTIFAELSGDVNPLHLDSDFAKQKGFCDRVAHGMMVSSFYSTLAGVYLPGKSALLHGIQIAFQKPVYLDNKLTIFGEIIYRNEAYKQVEIRANITNQKGETVSTAKLKVGVIQ